MTTITKAAQDALEALDSLLDVAMVPMTCEGLCSADSAERWDDFSARRDALRAALQDKAGEPIAWEATTDAYIKHITDAQYQRFSTEVKRWYKPYKCSSCAEKPAHSYDPAGVLMHWPMPGGGRKIIWSEDDLTAITIGCPVTNIFKESAVAAQPAPVVPDGCALVPVDPDEMWAYRVIRQHQPHLEVGCKAWLKELETMLHWHTAMIAASQQKGWQ